MRRLASIVRDILRLARMMEAQSIARRMFVTNAFDGLLSALGIVLGNYMGGVRSPVAYVTAVLGSAIAMGFYSGFVATYISERAERLRELHETEKAVLHDLRGTIYERAAKLVPIYVAAWSGFGATVLPLVGVTPFILAEAGLLALEAAVAASVTLILAMLFVLGYYLGKVSGENELLSGARLAAIGVAAAATLLTLTVASRW